METSLDENHYFILTQWGGTCNACALFISILRSPLRYLPTRFSWHGSSFPQKISPELSYHIITIVLTKSSEDQTAKTVHRENHHLLL
mmetsp:Transcript_22865/g.47162  ORF Transcript_22865/g.47162 Transcript_22865/m.47162 type:complete len:87 (-) Transcript_22865:1012-1272(-)